MRAILLLLLSTALLVGLTHPAIAEPAGPELPDWFSIRLRGTDALAAGEEGMLQVGLKALDWPLGGVTFSVRAPLGFEVPAGVSRSIDIPANDGTIVDVPFKAGSEPGHHFITVLLHLPVPVEGLQEAIARTTKDPDERRTLLQALNRQAADNGIFTVRRNFGVEVTGGGDAARGNGEH